MTGSVAPARPVYLDVAPDPVFALYHELADGALASDVAVLICPPWGWDEVASYTGRRAWADELATAGHPTLRIDLPGTGDSGGTAADAGRVGAWTDAIAAGAAWLAVQPGVTRVAAIGLGLGGLLAMAAISAGAPIDELVLWGAPVRGRTFLREQRAFSALEDTRLGGDGVGSGTLPDGWLEVGGFVLSAETIADLGSLELPGMTLGRVRRALLLQRDGVAADPALATTLTAAGADVTIKPGHGWTGLVFHPEQYAPPVGVFHDVAEWLASPSVDHPDAVACRPPAAAGHLETTVGGTRIRESPVRIDQPMGSLFGILGEPLTVPASTVCAVFLNAGAVRRTGPNRLWVDTTRRWNACGIPTIRMDLEGIGDADGDPGRYRNVGNFYTAEVGRQVDAILADLAARGFGPRFVLVGLCAGGYWAFHTAAADRRVIEAIIVNPRAVIWDDGLLARREAAKVGRLSERALWGRIVHGEIPLSRMVEISRAMATTAARATALRLRRIRGEQPSPPTSAEVETLMDALREHGTRVVLAFADNEPVRDELEADGILAHLDRWPNVTLSHLPGGDHTLRPVSAQAAYHELVDAELARLTGGRPAD